LVVWPGFSVTMPVSVFSPLLAEGVAEVVLVLDGDEVRGGRRIHLDGLDLRRQAFDAYAVLRGRIDHPHGGSLVRPFDVVPVVVEEVGAERRSGDARRSNLVPSTGTILPVGKTLS
jgi:hypothetical protein